MFYTVQDVAKLLNVSEVHITRLIRKGEIPAMRCGTLWRISDIAFDAYVEKQLAEVKRQAEQQKLERSKYQTREVKRYGIK